MNPYELSGRGALVTGASKGIGRAIAIELGRLGARVVVAFRSDESGARAAVDAACAAGAPAAFAVRGDVSDPEGAARVAADAAERLGAVDVLVNNAGIQHSGMMHKTSDADWRAVFATNVDAVFYLGRAVLPDMRARGTGQIVNVASASSYLARPGAASYVASKHALIGLTKAMALENIGRGIRINAVAPGATDTAMLEGLSEEARAGLVGLVPMGRVAEPEEIARMVGWVVTHATYSTGNVFHASGGVVMG